MRVDTEPETSTRTTSPKRRLRSSTSTASSRSSASSETSKSASRVTRKVQHSTASISGKRRERKCADHALERDEEAAASDREEARQAFRDLDPRESLLAGLGLADEDGEAEREGRDVRERLSRADCERRQHREDLALEELFQFLELLAVAVVDVADRDAGFGESRAKIPLPELGLDPAQLLHTAPDLGQRLLGRAAVGRANGEARLLLVHEPRDPHHEELVQVGREVRGVPSALQERQARGCGLVENASVVVQPGELSIERSLRNLGLGRN